VRYAFYQCQRCGLVRLHPFPKAGTKKRLYSYSDPNTHNQDLSPLMKMLYHFPDGKHLISQYVRLAHIERQHIVEQLLASGRLLDVGCGTGEFLTLFDPKKWKLSGVEVNSHLTTTVKKTFPAMDILNSTIEAFITDEKFDVVTLWHVFEHISNPAIIIKKLHRLIRKDGYLIIEVPQADSVVRKLFGRHWNLLLVPEHLYFWTESSLSSFLSKHGFVVKHIQFRGYVSSFPASFVNWSRNQGVPKLLSVLAAFCFFPALLLVYKLFPSTRDNLLIIAQKSRPKKLFGNYYLNSKTAS